MPPLADPARQQFVTELAALMDARRERIGEHAAQTQPAWAVNALGPVPDDPVDRLDWSSGHRRSAPTGSCTGSNPTPTRSAPSR